MTVLSSVIDGGRHGKITSPIVGLLSGRSNPIVTPPTTNALILEDGGYLLLEDGGKLLLE